MPRNIVLIQGHPDPRGGRYGHALAEAYTEGARAGGHTVSVIDVAQLDFPLLRTQEDWNEAALPPSLQEAQDAIGRADHLVILFPLWLGTLPALLKGFLEQVLRPGFAIDAGGAGMWRQRLKGKSARIIVTMGMPAFVFRWYFMAHGIRSLERNILKFCGISAIRETLIGMVGAKENAARLRWLEKVRALGRGGQ